jgi:hypothetical protein
VKELCEDKEVNGDSPHKSRNIEGGRRNIGIHGKQLSYILTSFNLSHNITFTKSS